MYWQMTFHDSPMSDNFSRDLILKVNPTMNETTNECYFCYFCAYMYMFFCFVGQTLRQAVTRKEDFLNFVTQHSLFGQCILYFICLMRKDNFLFLLTQPGFDPCSSVTMVAKKEGAVV